ncbi:MAG: hypothetical protein ABFS39_11895 [Pseudomonadota bacterium]
MSLLDELKQQAEQQRKNDDQSTAEARREAVYQQNLRPRMHAVLNYLSELSEQLKVVDPDVRHDFSLPGIGEVKGLRQAGYIVNADNTDQTKIIRLRFHCVADSEKEYAVKPKSTGTETRDFLESQNMRYAEWPIRDNTQQVVGINFQLKLKVEIQCIFQVDLEQSAIKMVTTNFNAFGVDRSVVQPERITDEWLDNLGNYILRRNQNLHNLEIGDSEKALIRQRLETEKKARQQELELAMQQEREELEERRRNSLLGKFKNLGKK